MSTLVQQSVFISYRRDTPFHTRAVYQYLSSRGYDVFMDVERLPSGSFADVILGEIAARAHFVVILTPTALNRCHEPGDWLRREIEHAIETRRNIVPLMFDGFTYTAAAPKLTGRLAMLASYNSITVHPDYFEEAMARLTTRFLSVDVAKVAHPTPPSATPPAAKPPREDATHPAKPAAAPQATTPAVSPPPVPAAAAVGAEASPAAPTSEPAPAASMPVPDPAPAADTPIRSSFLSLGDLVLRARAYNQAGKYDLAIADATDAIARHPRYATAYYERAYAHDKRQDYDLAIADYSACIDHDPSYAAAYNNRGWACFCKGDYEQALNDYSSAIQFNPNYALAYFNRGQVYALKGEYRRAVTEYTKAIKRRASPVWLRARAAAHRALGKVTQAEADERAAAKQEAG